MWADLVLCSYVGLEIHWLEKPNYDLAASSRGTFCLSLPLLNGQLGAERVQGHCDGDWEGYWGIEQLWGHGRVEASWKETPLHPKIDANHAALPRRARKDAACMAHEGRMEPAMQGTQPNLPRVEARAREQRSPVSRGAAPARWSLFVPAPAPGPWLTERTSLTQSISLQVLMQGLAPRERELEISCNLSKNLRPSVAQHWIGRKMNKILLVAVLQKLRPISPAHCLFPWLGNLAIVQRLIRYLNFHFCE